MTYDELMQKLEEHNITQFELLQELEMSPQSLANWKRRGVPQWVEMWLNNYILLQQYRREIIKKSQMCIIFMQELINLINECEKHGVNPVFDVNFQELINKLESYSFFTEIEKLDNVLYSLEQKSISLINTLNTLIFYQSHDKQTDKKEIASQLTKEHQEVEHYKRLAQELEKLKKEFEEIKKKIEGNG